jgi:hypothetical protein
MSSAGRRTHTTDLRVLEIGIFLRKGLDSIFGNPKILPDGQISAASMGSRLRHHINAAQGTNQNRDLISNKAKT